ncbi:serine/threonine-protein kinase nekl-2-like [Mizuhopecten yessoensis]|uniref:non-specific serine/threonine protein kinase n=1 Tax=Mizuhopecten yessoensis TaxID=6573 RepID=A0A210R4D9_MIZYE|nr:serine/threonine-protein kinase nekl-2-like [Mizuhopecten yessoensis]OWF55869.1 Serine/threonine-protein kinase Nek4 [Mizuhopecten yessoensis]
MAGFAARKKTFGDYVEVDLIGKGTFGQVYLVKKADEKGQKESRIQKYALKKIPFPAAANRKREEELVQREEDILKTVKHRHLVRYVDSFRDKDTVFMVMEYCDGGTLHSYIRELNEGMPEDMFLCFVEQIAQGLKYLHKKKIMHRDIKTKNILMSRGNILKICDFGISKVVEHAGPAANSVWMGTPRYMSPEVVRKEPYAFKTDIWSLGCTAYEMAMSEYAFSAESLAKIFKDISVNTVPDLSGIPYCDDIKTLIRNMLEVTQGKRPSAKDVLKIIAEHECTVPITPSAKASRKTEGDEDSEQSTLASTTERSLPHTQAAFGTTGDSGLGVSSKLKHSSTKAKRYLEGASTELQSMLVEIIHSRNGVDIVKEIKSASSLKEAEQILKRNQNTRVTKKFSDIMQIIESLYNTEREIHRLEDIDTTFSSLESQTFSTFSSTPSRSRTRSRNT